MPMETYLIYLAAVAVFFATPPDTSQLLIISNSIRRPDGERATNDRGGIWTGGDYRDFGNGVYLDQMARRRLSGLDRAAIDPLPR